MSNNTIEQIKKDGSQTLLNPFSLLGYILGGISLLNLVREFKLIKLYGLVKDWTDAFSYFILGVRDFLFGWIEISWLSVTDVESYFLVIMFLFVSSYLRALLTDHMSKAGSYSEEMKHSTGLVVAGTFLTGFIFYAVIFLVMAIIALLLPNIVTIILFSVTIFFTMFFMLFPSADANLEAIMRARLNLIGSFIVFLILVAVNYGFKP